LSHKFNSREVGWSLSLAVAARLRLHKVLLKSLLLPLAGSKKVTPNHCLLSNIFA
jgi:hypothetical protein